ATKIAVASRCPERFCLAASMRRSTSRSVRYSRPGLPTVTFTEVGAALRSREFSMETALPPVRTVTDSHRGVTDSDGCSSPAPPDIAGGMTPTGHAKFRNFAGQFDRYPFHRPQIPAVIAL